ncbi:hypothetical protein BpHYR1_000255 [Brachionus plicatilis]|uniref:Uncharacterized protein n=1 Tax=Brachionus plicatilis TaxID=10195 RepID=A0A3M7R6L2_BRAPC|nr:hypothetical protein BpHYR1_000255 [Brachionus plicatilis]
MDTKDSNRTDHCAFLRCVALHDAHFSLISRIPSKLLADCVASEAIGASDAIFENFSNLSSYFELFFYNFLSYIFEQQTLSLNLQLKRNLCDQLQNFRDQIK